MDVDEEIRRAQQERLSLKAKKPSFDDDIYGGEGRSINTSEYNTELYDDDDVPAPSTSSAASKYSIQSRENIRKALSSYTAPKALLEHRPKADAKETDFDPMAEFKRKTVAEREDEYRARWRKRKLSPPRTSAFDKDAGAAAEGARSYRDIMLEQHLEKEKKEVMRKIQKKKEEEEETRKRELKDRNQGTLWDVKEEGTDRSATARPAASGPSVPSGPSGTSTSSVPSVSNGSGNWVLNIMKNGQRAGDPIIFNPQTTPTFTIGRDRASNLPIDHPSASKQHAKITFKTSGSNAVPQIIDLGSTNGTFLNDTQIGSHKEFPIKGGDTLKFGGSTREYTLCQQ